jgi:molybdopterin converting factor small subunit
MTVRVRLFAAYRDAVGTGELELPATAGLTVGQAWGQLLARHPELNRWPPSAAVNRTFASLTTGLSDGDEVAFLPPVSGG